MATTDYYHLLDTHNRTRVTFKTSRGKVNKFCVQYETLIDDKWEAILRYDTAHGYAHKDILTPHGLNRKESINFGDFSLALTYAQEDLLRNWENYRENYLRRVKL